MYLTPQKACFYAYIFKLSQRGPWNKQEGEIYCSASLYLEDYIWAKRVKKQLRDYRSSFLVENVILNRK
jgi:hypothetical protein